MADGQLSVAEYDERTAAAYAAKTYGELDKLTGDLALTPPPPQPGSSQSSDRAIAIMSGFTRKGQWTVAPEIDAIAFWGGGEIDMRQARFGAAQVHINAIAIMGGIEITIPPGVSVEVRGAGIMGGFDHVSASHPGAPKVVISGFAFWGGVSVKIED